MNRTITEPPYAGIVFDCDSTLATIEGIECLAESASDEVKQTIATWTTKAMEGRVPLEEAYGARLQALQPTQADVDRIGGLYSANVLPNAKALIAALQFLGKRVFVVSGGLLQPVREFAVELGVAAEDTFAVGMRFDANGRYANFDEASPLARSGGKLEVLSPLAKQIGALALIGDGATDLEAAPVCARFVAFAGVFARENVMQAADRVCTSPDLAALLPHLCSAAEIATLADHSTHSALVESARVYP